MKNVVFVLGLLLTVLAPAFSLELPEAASGATGIFFAEVQSINEKDMTPCDGNWTQEIKLKIERHTGLVRESIIVVKRFGGLRPRGVPTPPPQNLDMVNPLVKLENGGKYWFATSPDSRHEQFPIGVINWWKEDDSQVVSLFEKLLKDDAFSTGK